jgi:hypothetical protein
VGKVRFHNQVEEVFLMVKRFGSLLVLAALVAVCCFHGEALAKKRLKDYGTIVVRSVIVKADAGIPKRYAEDLKDALLRQLQRYNTRYKWAKKITTTMPSSKVGVVVLDAEILTYVAPSVGKELHSRSRGTPRECFSSIHVHVHR